MGRGGTGSITASSSTSIRRTLPPKLNGMGSVPHDILQFYIPPDMYYVNTEKSSLSVVSLKEGNSIHLHRNTFSVKHNSIDLKILF